MQHKALENTNIGSHRLKNRTAVAPMTRVSTNGDGVSTTAMADYYAKYAEGGFAMVITEGAYTDRTFSQAYPNQPGLTNSAQQKGWTEVATRIKEEGAIPVLQLMHAGALSQHLSNTRAPSAIQPARYMMAGYSHKQGAYPKPHAMNLAEIDNVIKGMTDTARRAEEAGFQGVEIHGANGYLLDQFLTDYTNEREDHYGGSVQNRIRLTAEIISSVKNAVAPDMIVGIRLSQGKVNDFNYQLPNGLEDGKVIFSEVHKAGADYIHFATPGQGFDHGSLTRDGHSLPKLAREITGLPVIANGGLQNPEEAQRILEEGHGDIVALGTGALVNTNWPRKLAASEEIRQFSPEFFADGVTI